MFLHRHESAPQNRPPVAVSPDLYSCSPALSVALGPSQPFRIPSQPFQDPQACFPEPQSSSPSPQNGSRTLTATPSPPQAAVPQCLRASPSAAPGSSEQLLIPSQPSRDPHSHSQFPPNPFTIPSKLLWDPHSRSPLPHSHTPHSQVPRNRSRSHSGILRPTPRPPHSRSPAAAQSLTAGPVAAPGTLGAPPHPLTATSNPPKPLQDPQTYSPLHRSLSRTPTASPKSP